ncbi:hypothetical protein Cgig2_009029 [Carnegiea gigantea]|uniref:DUF4283 domain-containing protein n=1 Tax=Carnegiea gigantea TaxID=171969 RepID=A0A9Q1KFA3_9CARY|nr:hypothetical protein Cgig2_009029 [Carnegiea gigantea]
MAMIKQEAELTSNQVKPYSSCAILVDPDEGTDLKFLPAEVIIGRKVAKIGKTDVEDEIDILTKFYNLFCLRSKILLLKSFKGFIICIWATYDIDKIIQSVSGDVLGYTWTNRQWKKEASTILMQNSFLVNGLEPGMDLQTESIRSLPIWIQFPKLGINFNQTTSGIEWKPTKCTHYKMLAIRMLTTKRKGGTRLNGEEYKRETQEEENRMQATA